MREELYKLNRLFASKLSRCGRTGKSMFRTANAAQIRACEIFEGSESPGMMRAYRCQFCGGWHLTTKDRLTPV